LPLTARSVSFLNRGAVNHLAFFSVTNLLGGGVSLVIGVVMYLFFVRPILYKEKEGYLNKWPEWLDLEGLFYRPVCCRFLPWLGCTIASFLDHLPDSRLIAVWIPKGVTGLFRCLDGLLDSQLMTKYVAGFFTLIAKGCDRLLECGFVTKMIPTILVALGRILDEMVDHVLLLCREIFLTNRQELNRAKNHSIFTRLANALAEGLHRVGRFLWPGRWLPRQEATDMRYGNTVTNAVSFGLLLCAVGIVAAIVYVFIRVGA
ncbi:MAG: hypothetical protein IJ189_11440, partial [Clostridia bacterium]|nr:hypothetical protein [Clostridia bacterium]